MIPDWLTRKRSWKEMVMYAAHPTRLHKEGRGSAIEEFVYHKTGFCPLNPFDCGKFKYFEGGRMARKRTLSFGLSIQRNQCGQTGVFGISEGVMGEVRDRLGWDEKRNIWVYPDAGFDPLWEEEYERLKNKKEYGDVLADLRGGKWLVAFVGTRGIGKTYWIEKLTDYFRGEFGIVRNVTTRNMRVEEDKKYYHLVTPEQFQFGINKRLFLEHVEYRGNNYGSSMDEIKKTLRLQHGMFAITPEGAKALYAHRLGINIFFIVLESASDEVLKRNLTRRGIKDEAKQIEIIKGAKDFIVPMRDIPHRRIQVTGTEYDKKVIFDIFEAIMKG